METGGVLYGDSLDKHVLAIGKADDVVTHLLLCLGGVSDIRRCVLCVPRIEEGSIGLLHATDYLFEDIPLHVTHLTTLDGTPVLTIAVDDSLTSDGDVLALRGTDAGINTTACLCLGIDIQRLV